MNSCFSSRLVGSPLGPTGSAMNIAPYFLASGRNLSALSFSKEIELIRALPGYFLRAISMVFSSLVSMHNGSDVSGISSSSTSLISCFSSTPLIPTFTSRMAAPSSSCFAAKSQTIDRLPSLSSAWSFFLPVGLILSPTIMKGSSIPNEMLCLSLVRNLTPFCFLVNFLPSGYSKVSGRLSSPPSETPYLS